MKKTVLFAAALILALMFSGCDNLSNPGQNTPAAPQTPVAGDYTFGSLSQTAGNVTAVTVTAKDGKSPGAVSNVRYAGNTAVPQEEGTYAVTFDVAPAAGWNAAAGLSAGNLVVAAVAAEPGPVFTTNDTGAEAAITITGYTGSGKDVVIPAEINGKPVTIIGVGAFQDKLLTSVVIPAGVTAIANQAFAGNRLTGVAIPAGVTRIGGGAFADNLLTEVAVPAGVTAIGDGAFAGNRLTEVVIPDGLTRIGAQTFQHNRLTNVAIPDSVTSIGGEAFARNLLTGVVIPYRVTSIAGAAFFDNLLTEVAVPAGVTYIGGAAFELNSLISLTIGADVALDSDDPSPPGHEAVDIVSGFNAAYVAAGKAAGTYTRPNSGSSVWTKE